MAPRCDPRAAPSRSASLLRPRPGGNVRHPLTALALLLTTQLGAQAPAPRTPHVIHWYEAGVATAGVLVLMLVDEPVQRFAQRNRSATSDDIAAVARHMGQPEVFVTTSLGLVGVGLVAKQPEIARAGGRAATCLALAAVIELSLKAIIGRARPDAGLGAFHFEPLSGSVSLPSGHTTVAFALATSLAGEVRPTWARIGLYGLAAGTAWSRVNDDRHWLSDIAAGALIGVTAGKLVHGRWQLFGLRPPAILVSSPRARVVGWSIAF